MITYKTFIGWPVQNRAVKFNCGGFKQVKIVWNHFSFYPLPLFYDENSKKSTIWTAFPGYCPRLVRVAVRISGSGARYSATAEPVYAPLTRKHGPWGLDCKMMHGMFILCEGRGLKPDCKGDMCLCKSDLPVCKGVWLDCKANIRDCKGDWPDCKGDWPKCKPDWCDCKGDWPECKPDWCDCKGKMGHCGLNLRGNPCFLTSFFKRTGKKN
jgi:hypothetical protein